MSLPHTNNAAPALRPGDKLDKFDIVEQIGAGGMSVVWKAHDRLLNRFVAVKQILITAADADNTDAFREKFRREAKVQQAVGENNKHLVSLIDIIEEPRGLFLVMEYVDGPSLEQILAQNRKPMDVRQALGIMGATALALGTIHAKDILHRDLKPSNILLPRVGGLKVADFGLASLIAEQESLTQGSARYMAPELFINASADPRADLYSLGMIAYEALAGRDAFEETFRIVLRDQRNQSMRWMKWHTSPRAIATPLNKLNPSIPANISELVARLMEKERSRRIGSTRELLDAMQRVMAKEEDGPEPHNIKAQHTPTAPAEATAPLPKRSKLPYILTTILVIQILVVVGGWVWYARGNARIKQDRLDAATAQYEDARKQYQASNKILVDAGDSITADQLNVAREGFTNARNTFESLANAKEWPESSNLHRDSLARAFLSQAMVDLILERNDLVKISLDSAQKTKVFDDNLDVLQSIRREAEHRELFGNILAEIDKLIINKQIGAAKDRLSEEQSRSNRTKREIEQLAELGAKIENQLKRVEVERLLGIAADLVKQGKRADAMVILNDAKSRYPGTPEIEDAYNSLSADTRISKLIGDAEAAQATGRLLDAASAFELAAAIRPDATISTRASALRSEHAYAEGMRKLAEGNTDEAREAFTNALGYYDNENARRELKKIESGSQRDAFIRAGDKALEAGDFASAVKQYENANKIDSDEAILGKITDANVRLEVRTGREFLDQGDMTKAREAFLRAQTLRPTSGQAQRGLGEVAKRESYRKLMESGDKFRRDSKFGDAKREYLRAREVWQTDEIALRLTDTEYEQWIAQGRQHIATQSWKAANAVLQAAAKMRDTEEVRQLLAEVARHDEKPATEN